MPVKSDATGRRWVEAEVEIPGSPEEVWEAIATGPGISSWFVPTEKLADGKIINHFGAGMDVVATQTVWEPPHRFVAESEMGPDAPTMATEWIVEAKSGSNCVVRVVHSWFTNTDDWDNQIEDAEAGWADYFEILKLYLARFRGQSCSGAQMFHPVAESAAQVWAVLTERLCLAGIVPGKNINTSVGSLQLAGSIERAGQAGHPHKMLLLLDKPVAGIANLLAMDHCGQSFISIQFYLYGSKAPDAAKQYEAECSAWLNKNFPLVEEQVKVS